MLHDIRTTYPVVFEGGRRGKPHSASYKEFNESWGFQKVIYDLADEKMSEIHKINQEYLSDAFTFLTYLIKKGDMEQDEDAFQEQLRAAKRKH